MKKTYSEWCDDEAFREKQVLHNGGYSKPLRIHVRKNESGAYKAIIGHKRLMNFFKLYEEITVWDTDCDIAITLRDDKLVLWT